jgi:hypothetical protein
MTLTDLEQKEATMQATTSWEAVGIEKGIEKERRSLISPQLEQKMGELSARLNEQLRALAIALLGFKSIDDLTTWLQRQG